MPLRIELEDYDSIAEDRDRLLREIAVKQRIALIGFDPPAEHTLVARLDGRVVGILEIYSKNGHGSEMIYFVDIEYQNKGIGSQLLDRGIEVARENSLPYLTESVTAGSVSERMLLKREFKEYNKSLVEELISRGVLFDPRIRFYRLNL